MRVADGEFGQAPVTPDSSQAFVGGGIARIQGESVIEVTVSAIQHAKLEVAFRDDAVGFGCGRVEDL
jgi:hypothetical protein